MARASTYTTYLRTELDPVTQSNYRRLEEIAAKTYDVIASRARIASGIPSLAADAEQSYRRLGLTGTVAFNQIAAAARRAAAETSKANIPTRVTVNARGAAAPAAAPAIAGVQISGAGAAALTQQNTALAQQATLAQRVAVANDNMSGAARRATGASGDFTRASRTLARETSRGTIENEKLIRSLSVVGTTLNVVQGPLGPLAGRVRATGDALQQLTGITLGLAGAGAAIFAFASSANQYAVVESRLKPLYESQREVNAAMAETTRIAFATRSALAPTVDLYAKLTSAGRDLGLSQERIARVTEIANKAATLSGGMAATREAGLYQFSQGIGSGTLAGEELKSVKENTTELARAIAAGFKNADGSIGTTIGNLKKVASEGKLSALVVVESLERAEKGVNEKFARLPNTLSTAATEFSTSFTTLVGQFDRATGTTSFLADSLSVVAQNLRTVTALAVGVAAAFVAPKIVSFAAGIATAVAQQIALNTAVQAGNATMLTAEGIQAAKLATAAEGAVAEAVAAQARQRALEAEIVLLKEAQLQYAAQIPQAAKAAAASRAALAQQQGAAASGQFAGDIGGAGVRAAKDSLTLNTYRKNLAATNTALAATEAELASATTASGAAQIRAAAGIRTATAAGAALTLGTRVLTGALNLLKASLPILAITAITSAIFYLATAESAAERGARKLEEAQKKLGDAVDTTTGKIREQNKVKLAGIEVDLRRVVNASADQVRAARSAVADAAPLIRYNGGAMPTRSQQQALQLVSRYERNDPKLSTAELQKQLDALGKTDGAVKAFADRVRELGGAVVDSSREYQTAAAQYRLNFQGGTDPETQRRARGDLSGGRVAGTVGRNLDAEADARARLLRDPVRAATIARDDALKDLTEKKGTLEADDYIEKRAKILNDFANAMAGIDRKNVASANREQKARERAARAAERAAEATERRTEQLQRISERYDEAPRAIDTARQDTRKIQDLVGERVNGIREVTKANPLGQGTFNDTDAAERIQRIVDSLQRPLRDITKEYERQADVSNLIAQGRTAEAEALQRAHQLIDQNGVLEAGQYQVLLRAAEAQQALNTRLAERGRIVETLGGAVDQVRGTVEQFLNELPNGAGKAAAGLGKGLLDGFRQSGNRLLTDQLFGGVQQRVDDLISGKTKVQNATEFVSTQLSRGGSAAERFARVVGEVSDAVKEVVGEAVGYVRTTIQNRGVPGLGTPGGTIERVPDTPGSIVDSVLPAGQSIGRLLVGAGSELALSAARTVERNNRAADAVTTLASASVAAAATLNDAAASLNVGSSAPIGTLGTTGANTLFQTSRSLDQGVQSLSDRVRELGGDIRATVSEALGGGPAVGSDGTVVVTAPSQRRQRPAAASGGPQATPTLREIYNETGRSIGAKIDTALGTKFASKLGGKLGDALAGAGKGTAASGIAKQLGVLGKQSTTGAALGGAIGGMIPALGPFGAALGGIVGGTLGGLFKKTKTGVASLAIDNDGAISGTQATGTGKAAKAAATGLASSVAQTLNQVKEQLDLSLSGVSNIKLGTYNDEFRVNINGGSLRGNDKSEAKNEARQGLYNFGTDEAAAIAFATQKTLEKATITGISQASINILKSGQDLQKAIEKASLIESIPKRLAAIQTPVKYAVDTLNNEFDTIIKALNEGKATAAQYAEAQQLYDLERARTIAAAQTAASTAIQDYLDSMNAGPSSPLNKATVYENAQKILDPLKADVLAGKVVDESKLIEAVKGVDAASRTLNQSSVSYFNDFSAAQSLLTRAQQNASGAGASKGENLGALPASPFDSAAVRTAIASGSDAQVKATQDNTTVTAGLLNKIIDRLDVAPAATTPGRAPTGRSSMDALAAFR